MRPEEQVKHTSMLDASQASGIMPSMGKEANRLARTLRDQIRRSDMSRYAISKATGIDQATLSRFMDGSQQVSLDAADKLLDLFGLQIVPKSKRKTKRGR